jgi:hypothetical protein
MSDTLTLSDRLDSLTYVDGDGTEQNARAYLDSDTGHAPGSPFGTYPSSFVPVILLLAATHGADCGEPPTTDSLDGYGSMVVNASAPYEVAYSVLGSIYSLDPFPLADVLDVLGIDGTWTCESCEAWNGADSDDEYAYCANCHVPRS